MNEMMNKPVTLTVQEYDAVMTNLAQRDPIMALLMRKQAEAQHAAIVPVTQDVPAT